MSRSDLRPLDHPVVIDTGADVAATSAGPSRSAADPHNYGYPRIIRDTARTSLKVGERSIAVLWVVLFPGRFLSTYVDHLFGEVAKGMLRAAFAIALIVTSIYVATAR